MTAGEIIAVVIGVASLVVLYASNRFIARCRQAIAERGAG